MTSSRRKQKASPKATTPQGLFHYSLPLEHVLGEFYGHDGRWYNMAATFDDPVHVRGAIVGAVKAIRKRLKTIVTADDRLLVVTDITLDAIQGAAKTIDQNGTGMLEVLSGFMQISAHLLGYDWGRGAPNREVVYFQTLEQQFRDDTQRHPDSAYGQASSERQHRVEIVKLLHSKQLRVAQIARILNVSEHTVKDMLVRDLNWPRPANVKDTKDA